MNEQRAEPRNARPFVSAWLALGAADDGDVVAKSEQADSESAPGEDSSSSQTFRTGENSSYFQFFRGLYEEYAELPASRRRLFKLQCLQCLHELLDEQERERAACGAREPAIAILPND